MRPNPQRKFDSTTAYFASLAMCPRIDRDDAAVVKQYMGSLASHSRCLAEEFDASEAFDRFSIDGGLYEQKTGTGLRESSIIHGARPPAQPREPPAPMPEYRRPAMPIPDEQPKKIGRPQKRREVRKVPAYEPPLPPRTPALEYEYTCETMRAIREFLIPKWIKDGQSKKEICDALHSAWPAPVIDPIIKLFFDSKEWPFTYA